MEAHSADEHALQIPANLHARNLRILADAVRQGYEIVTTEPSTALCLTHEYVNLLDSDDARPRGRQHF